MTRWVSLVALIVAILVMGALFYRIVSRFFVPIFLAALLVVIFRPLHQWILQQVKNRARTAAALTTAAIFLIVLVPAASALIFAVGEAVSLGSEFGLQRFPARFRETRRLVGLEMPQSETLRSLNTTADSLQASLLGGDGVRHSDVARLDRFSRQIEEGLDEETPPYTRELLLDLREELAEVGAADPEQDEDYEAKIAGAVRSYRRFYNEYLGGSVWRVMVETANPAPETLQNWREQGLAWIRDKVLPLGGATASIAIDMVLGLVIMGVALYFFLIDGPGMIKTIMRLSPLEDRHEQELLDEFVSVSRAVVLATLLSAIVQAVLAGIGFAFAGLETVVLLMMLTAVFALIPFVGAAAVWFPVSLWLFFVEERTTAAVLLALYGALIVSTSDNLVKPMVLHGQSKLHPLLALLSVLGGVQALGPIGILVGPMVVAFMQTLLNMLRRELISLEPGNS